MNKIEVDAWWGSYSMRSQLPLVAAALLLSCLVWVTAWLIEPRPTGIYIVTTLVILLWIALALNWAYRIFGFNYRLTTRRLFHERGLVRRKLQTVHLEHVSEVVVKQNSLLRLLNVGQVYVKAHDSAPRRVVLNGVFAPDYVAEKIRALSAECKRLADSSVKEQ